MAPAESKVKTFVRIKSEPTRLTLLVIKLTNEARYTVVIPREARLLMTVKAGSDINMSERALEYWYSRKLTDGTCILKNCMKYNGGVPTTRGRWTNKRTDRYSPTLTKIGWCGCERCKYVEDVFTQSFVYGRHTQLTYAHSRELSLIRRPTPLWWSLYMDIWNKLQMRMGLKYR